MTTTTLSKNNIDSIYNLSPLQTGLLFHAVEAGEDSPYHAQHCFAIQGELDATRFAEAWRTCLARHPILRSAFFWQQVRQPLQIAAKTVDLPLTTHDWRDRNPAQQQDALAPYLEADRNQGFNLNQPPLLRLHLIQRRDDAYWFILSSHHLILDGWSMAIVLGEVLQQLQADSTPAHLPAPKPFEAYIAWLKDRNPLEKERFWREQLKGFRAPTSFGIAGEARPYHEKTPPYRERLEALGRTDSARIEQWCRRHGVTTATLISGAWALLLARYNGCDDVVYGTTVAGRPPELAGSDEMVGMFINTLPSRAQLNRHNKVLNWLRELQEQQHTLQHYSDTPLVDIQRWSDLAGAQRNALFDTLVVFENYPVDEELRANSRLRIDPHYACLGHEEGALITHGRNHYPLTLVAVPDTELRLGLAYDLRFVDHDLARQLLERLKITVQQLCNHADEKLATLSLLSDAERAALQPSTALAPQPDEDFATRFKKIAKAHAAQPALVYSTQTLTYGELDHAADLLAARLIAAGVQRGRHVALLLEREPRWVIAMLAVLKAGATFVPLDVAYPEQRLRFILEDSDATLLLGSGPAPFTMPETCAYRDVTEPNAAAVLDPISVPARQPAYVIYTSGTSGRPKGVAVSHHALLSYVDALQNCLASQPGESLAALATVAADLGYTATMVALAHGRCLRLFPHAHSFDGDALAAGLVASPVDHLKITPSHLRGLLAVDQPQRILPRKTLILGGEACDQALVQQVLTLQPALRVLNHYGPTETTVGVLTAELDGRRAPILGDALANSQVRIVDGAGLPQAPGLPGEIVIAGHGLANGYHNNPRLTAERFRPNPFGTGDRQYHSGDRGVLLPDGGIQFLGRLDQQVKIRGFRVEPAEIAARIKTLDGVSDAVVIAERDGHSARLIAYLVGTVPPNQAAALVEKHLAQDLPAYMIPAAYVVLDQLPLTVNGKLDVRALPAPEQSGQAEKVTEPRDAVESILAEVWRDLLKHPHLAVDGNLYQAGADSIVVLQAIAALRRHGLKTTPRQVFAHPNIAELAAEIDTPSRECEQQLLGLWRDILQNNDLNRHSDFYAAGGDSIKALQMTAAARRQGLALSPRQLFQNPTPALLAQTLVAQSETTAPAPAGPAPFSLATLPADRLAALHAEAEVVDCYPVAPIQHGMLLDSLLDESARPYFNQVCLDVQIDVDADAMARACDLLVQRHAILRTGFVWDGLETPHQVLFAKAPSPFQSHDWRDQPAPQQQAAVAAYCAADIQRGFDFRSAPLWRLSAFRLGAAHSRLVWSHHHLILDGWSLPQLLQELLACYEAIRQGQPPVLPKAAGYSAYLQWLAMQSKANEQQFWQAQLADYDVAPLLPGKAQNVPAENVVRVALDQMTSDRLKAFAAAAKITLNTLVQAAWALTLARRNDRDDVVFGVTHAGRNLPIDDIDHILGVFINTVPLRLRIRDELSVRDWLVAVQNQNLTLDTMVHTRLSAIMQWCERPAEQALFESIVSFKNLPAGDETARLGDALGLQLEETHLGHNNLPLSLMFEPGAQLKIEAYYQGARFDADAIHQYLASFQTLCRRLVANPRMPVGAVTLLDDAEWTQMQRWSRGAEPATATTVNALFAAHAAKHPDQLALVDTHQTLTYGVLAQAVRQRAAQLRRDGVTAGDRVGLYQDRTTDMVVNLLAVLACGAVVVPLDPRLPAARCTLMLADASPTLVIGSGAHPDWMPANLPWVAFDNLADDVQEVTFEATAVSPTDLAYIIYTSGSTGKPKGVAVSHGAIANYACAVVERLALPAEAELTTAATVAADLGHTALYGALCTGRVLRLLPVAAAFDAHLFASRLADQPTDVLKIVPSHLEALLTVEQPHRLLPRHTLVFGGEALTAPLIEKVRALAPELQIVNHYGPSEATVGVLTHRVETHSHDEPRIPVGLPMAGCEAWVLDRAQRPLPVGVAGELYLGGRCLADGYWRNPSQTEAVFVAHPFAAGARLYRSGDRVVRRADGALVFLGRVDDQVKIRGYRVEPGELAAWLRAQDEVGDAAVKVWRDDHGNRLAAYWVPSQADADAAALQQRMQNQLPDYLVPADLVACAALPLNLNGKVDRNQLPDPRADQAQAQQVNAPRTPAETVLHDIWCALFRRDAVDIDANFFELGGDSILNLQVTAKARAAGLIFKPRDLFAHPTIAGLAAVAKTAAVKSPAPAPLAPELTPIQRAFFATERPNANHHNQALLLRLRRPVADADLERVMHHWAARHEGLRLRFNGGQARLVTAAEAVAPIIQADGTHNLTAWDAQVQASLDLANGPTWRLARRRDNHDDHLLIVFHHLLVDGVSWRILLDDLLQVLSQPHLPLPTPTPAPTAPWVAAARFWTATPAAAEVAQRWAVHCPTTMPSLPNAPADSRHGDSHEVTRRLDGPTTHRLLHKCGAALNTDVQDQLISALLTALAERLPDDQVYLDMEGHGREDWGHDIDLSDCVGWFTARYPVAFARKAETPLARLQQVKQQLRCLPAAATFGVLKHLAGDARLSGPNPCISFNYLGQVDAGADHGELAEVVADYDGLHQDPANPRQHQLNVVADIADGRLNLNFSADRRQYDQPALNALADDVLAALNTLIEQTADADVGARHNCDFPLVDMNQTALDQLLPAPLWRRVVDLYPATPMQAGLLFHAVSDGDNEAYLNQFRCKLIGPFDENAFEQAWQTAVQRHDILRTGFVQPEDGPALQVVYREARCPLHRADLRALDSDAAGAAVDSYLRQDRDQGFVWRDAPLMRLALFQHSATEHTLVWTRHHVLMDGWCSALLIDEVLRFYAAYTQKQHPQPTPIKPYRNYIAWRLKQDLGAAGAYWRERLAGFTEASALPRRRGIAPRTGYGEQLVSFDAAATRRLQSAARAAGVTLNTLCQAAWALLLGRTCDRTDVVFGATVAGRPTEVDGVTDMLGLFINSLPLRLNLAETGTVQAWLQQIQQLSVADRRFEHLALSSIQQQSELAGDEALFDSLLVFENYPGQATQLPNGLRFEAVTNVDRTHYPLTLIVQPDEVLQVQFSYRRDCFSDDQIELAAQRFKRIATALATVQDLAEVIWFDPSDIVQTATPASPFQPVQRWFERQLTLQPENTALTAGDTRLSYQTLHERAERWAQVLLERGAGPGQRIAVALQRGPHMAVAVLAVLKSGAAYVPLDISQPAQRRSELIAQAQPLALLTETAVIATTGNLHPHQLLLDQTPTVPAQHHSAVAPTADDAAYLIYTSGSTGRPKGVLMSHGALNNLIAWHMAQDGNAATTTFFAALNFDVSFQEMFVTWAAGGCLVVVDEATRTDSHALIDLLARAAVQRCFLPVVAFHHLCAALAESGRSLPHLHHIITAGEALHLPEKVRRALAEHLPNVQLSNHYGPSETHVVTALDLHGDPHQWPAVPAIGRAVAGVACHVCDHQGRPLPAEVPGELIIAGAAVGLGYWNDAAQTATRFVADPAAPGSRRYHSGDRVVRDRNGLLHFLERVDRQVKIRGYRIEPGEIEHALGRHNEVAAAAVVVRRQGRANQLHAFVQPTNAKVVLDPSVLRAFLAERLPDYMIPSQIAVLETLPMTRSGKLDRRALPDLTSLGETGDTPQGEWETRLCALFQTLLEVPHVAPGDDFFELGGHSLLAARLIARLRGESGRTVNVRDLFERPTPRLLAALLDGQNENSLPAPHQVDRGQPLPLSFGQQRLWFLDQLQGAQAAYNICLALELSGPLDPRDIEAALNQVVQRHEVLRTWFDSHGGQGRQVIEPELQLTLVTSDIADDAAVTDALQAEKNHTFDLRRAPLLRARLLRRNATSHLLVLTCHHIVFDGWSVGILARDFAAAYRNQRAGAPPLPENTWHYADFAVWQQSILRGAELTQRRQFWQKHLTGLPIQLPLTADFATVDTGDSTGAADRHRLAPASTHALHDFCRRRQVTPFAALLGVFRVWLAHHCGVLDFAVGSPDAGRTHGAFEDVIGFFVDQMVLRTPLTPTQTFADLARAERDGFLAAQNQNLPFDMLVELSGHPRDSGRNPLTQVQFNMHHQQLTQLDLPGLTAQPREVDTVHARFPLALHAAVEDDKLELSLVYRRAWFAPATITTWLTEIAELVAHAVADDSQTVAELTQKLQQRRDAAQAPSADRAAASLRGLRGRRPARGEAGPALRGRRRGVQISGDQLVTEQNLFPNGGPGLVLTPNHLPFDLNAWVAAQRDALQTKLQAHGALLLRGFNVAGEADLEELVQRWCPSGPADYAFGSTPRSRLHGRIYTSTDYPADQMIPLHGENAYTNRWPMKVFFHCVQAAEVGGETPIADMRAVYQALDPAVRERFTQRKLMYVRNFSELAVSWQEAFQSDHREAVATWCNDNGIDFTWQDEHRLQTRQICDAVQRHPHGGDWLWFNQAHLFHVSALPEQVQRDLLAEMTPWQLPRNVFYGDGGEIEPETLAAIRATLAEHTRAFTWQPGDVLVLDNMRCAHGRNPFQGARKIVVGMAEAVRADQLDQETR